MRMNEKHDDLDSRLVLTVDFESTVGRDFRHVYGNWREVYTRN
jgi:hypothetical protein